MLLDRQTLLLAAAATSLWACTAAPTSLTPDAAAPQPGQDATVATGRDAGPAGEDATVSTQPDATTAPGLARSDKARVRYKGEPLLRSELASALALPEANICKELGSFDCFGVHRIALGGVEPYTLGINEPFPDTAVTAPLAIERVALSGCRARVDLDQATPASAVIFKDVPAEALADPGSPAARAAIDRLYARFQSRHALPEEVQALVDLYADVAAANEPRPGRAWAILSCFAVATSIESLFY